jgi:hypothetical protein
MRERRQDVVHDANPTPPKPEFLRHMTDAQWADPIYRDVALRAIADAREATAAKNGRGIHDAARLAAATGLPLETIQAWRGGLYPGREAQAKIDSALSAPARNYAAAVAQDEFKSRLDSKFKPGGSKG